MMATEQQAQNLEVMYEMFGKMEEVSRNARKTIKEIRKLTIKMRKKVKDEKDPGRVKKLQREVQQIAAEISNKSGRERAHLMTLAELLRNEQSLFEDFSRGLRPLR